MTIEFTDKNARIIQINTDEEGGEVLLKLLSLLPDSEFIQLPVIKRTMLRGTL